MINRKYIDITREIILSIIDRNNTTVFLFGSRAENSARSNSDIDIGFMCEKKIEDKLFNRIRAALDESIVPFHVDLIDFNNCDTRFREIALEKIEIWNNAKNSFINC